MNIEKLKYYIDLVENGSFTKTAKLNHVSQTTISQQIASLERQYEVILIDRNQQPVVPTELGKVFYSEVKQIYQRFKLMEERMNDIKNNKIKIKIAYTSIVDINILAQLINGSKRMVEYAKKEKEALKNLKNESKTDESKTSDTKEAEKKEVKETIWNDSKKDSLRNFMTQFSQTMNQEYKEYNQATNVDFYGVKLPNDVLDGQWTMAINEQPVQVQWSETGEGQAAYQLVAVYSDADTQPYLQKHAYFFILENGNPKVFVTQQNQGNDKNYFYFNQSKNAELNSGFEQIVLGKTVSNSSSNQAKTEVDWQKIARDRVEEQFPEWEVDRFEQQSEGIMNVFIKEKKSGSVAGNAVGAIDINTGKTSGF